jgi:C4-dicarboxylate-specific signal transduction histidine kinase
MIEFNELIADVVELCGENIKHKGIELNIENADNLKILCRPTEIAQVLVNLLSNSIDALENSTTKKWIKISAVNGVGGAEILVEDSGSGITKEVASNLMRPFFTTKSPGKGTGLGLSISRAILESHGGSLKLDNPFSPTRFVLRFEPPQVAKAS